MSSKAELAEEWSRSYLFRPKDNIISHIKLDAPKFIPSFERNCMPTNMTLLLGWEYGRIYMNELHDFNAQRVRHLKPKKIKNDYENWTAKRHFSRKPAFV